MAPVSEEAADSVAPFDVFDSASLKAEESFLQLLLTIEGGKPSQELFTLLFDLLITNSAISKGPQSFPLPAPAKKAGEPEEDVSQLVRIHSNGKLLDFFYVFFEILRLGQIPDDDQVQLCGNSISSLGYFVSSALVVIVLCILLIAQVILLRRLSEMVCSSTRLMAYCCCDCLWTTRLLRLLSLEATR